MIFIDFSLFYSLCSSLSWFSSPSFALSFTILVGPICVVKFVRAISSQELLLNFQVKNQNIYFFKRFSKIVTHISFNTKVLICYQITNFSHLIDSKFATYVHICIFHSYLISKPICPVHPTLNAIHRLGTRLQLSTARPDQTRPLFNFRTESNVFSLLDDRF